MQFVTRDDYAFERAIKNPTPQPKTSYDEVRIYFSAKATFKKYFEAPLNRKKEKIMASKKKYLDFIMDQLSELDGVTYRPMMGEYILYYHDKIIGGIYDDRLLVKPTNEAIGYMPNASYETPYEGAKEMMLVDEVDDKEFLAGLFDAMYSGLPTPKRKMT